MSDKVQAWGVFRLSILVSTAKGMTEKAAREQARRLNKFNPVGAYHVERMTGLTIPADSDFGMVGEERRGPAGEHTTEHPS